MVETAAAVAASAYANECGVCFPGLSSKLDEQATASGSSSSVANNADADSSKEIDHFWIQCDVCITWFHGKCVDVEEYESAVIDQYHCPTCQLQHGSSVWKAERNHHRYVFDDLTQDDLPTQIGTRCFIDDFKQNQDRFPLASDKQLIRLDSGYDFVSHFNERQEWMKPYLITHAEGLGLRMPGDDFSIEDCVGLMGADRAVDTIDVYKQHTYQMSLGRYLKKWHDVDRPRLYNILSLEFSHSKLCEVVGPPSIVPKLSWVHQFWPAGKADATTPTTLATLLHAGDVHVEHLRAKPEVALFCLIGMRDSYTDFHIDFGGSSVWYHVFKGAKVFYVVEPTDANLTLFGEYQKNPKRSEIFFGDLLPPGAVTRVVVEQGRTLFIPSGWIHAVWTPEDSLVFGGNFLHSLNIPMQLRIYEMELDCHTDERFMFPSFELTNWYAARSVLESLKEANEDGHLADAHLIKGARGLLPFLRTWIKRDKTNKRLRTSVTFGNIVQQLQRELNGQEKLRKRPNGDADSPSRRRQRSSPKSPRQRKNLKSLKLKLVLDKNARQSTVDKPIVREAEEKSEAMDVEEKKAVTPIKLSLTTATASALCSNLAKSEVSEGDENEEQ
uniref:JmjC domain-containing protein n=1 Tax=Plectus sambesii TaxID=2011161 RepID=A0A914X225_9BILA